MVLLNMDIINDLKCCGNCKHASTYTAQCKNPDSINFEITKAKGYCKLWDQDNLKIDDRIL